MATQSMQPTTPLYPEAKEGQRLHLTDLSNELWMEIVDHFEPVWENGGHDSWRQALGQLSLVNKRFRAVRIPKLFQHVATRSYEDELHTRLGTWPRDKQLYGQWPRHINPDPGTIDISTMKTNKFYDFRRHIIARYERSPPHGSVPTTVIDLLLSVPHLTEVRFNFAEGQKTLLPPIAKHVRETGTALPNVKRLKFQTEHSIEFIATLFPSVEELALRINDSSQITDALEVVTHLTSLRALQLTKSQEGWRRSDFKSLQEYIPHGVKKLLILGELDSIEVSGRVGFFSELTNLEHLVLTINQLVHPSLRPMDDRLLDEIDYLKDEHPCNEAPEEVALTYFQHCSNLADIYLTGHVLLRYFEPVFDNDVVVEVEEDDQYKDCFCHPGLFEGRH